MLTKRRSKVCRFTEIACSTSFTADSTLARAILPRDGIDRSARIAGTLDASFGTVRLAPKPTNTPTASSLILRLTLKGDGDIDGDVDFNDLVVLAQNHNTLGGATWQRGDAN